MAETIKPIAPSEEIVPPRGLAGFIGKFTVLRGAKRDLWLTFLIKLLIYTAYSITNKTLVLWLSRDLGFSDQAAGALVGWVWAPAMTIFTLLAGSLTDAIGLRRTFFLGVTICTFARTVMVLTMNPTLALVCGLLPLAIGEALGTPVLLAATRVYSTTAQRSIAFSILYALMNVGYFVAGYVFDFIRTADLHFNIAGFQPTPHQELFAVSLALEILLFPAIYFLRRNADRAARASDETREDRQSSAPNFWTRIAHTVGTSAKETAALFQRMIGQSGFYRLLAFFLFIGFLKAIFLQMDYVFPKFGDREMGLHAPVGKLAGINAIMIIVLAPVVGALTQRLASYRMVIIGSIICAAGVFVMTLPTDWFVPAANSAIGHALGHGYLRLRGPIHPYYIMSALYLVVFSVGEAFYSPRVYEYAASIAPPGQEASYGALAYLPFLVGKLLIGTSGWVLAAFCPEHGECRPAMLWLIFALAASVAPLGLIIFRRYIQVPEAGRQD
ncbi:MAG TPA: MFS transporter [Chthoniobacterales bacterium]|jgi:MFS family permease|nr:MFS transporter [Chthoniobacterales bacterium]